MAEVTWSEVPAPSRAARGVLRGGPATVLATLLGTAATVVLVLVPWSLQRLARVDPLHQPAGWIPLRRRDRGAARPWSPNGELQARPGRAMRLRYGLAMAALVVAITVAAVMPTIRGVGRVARQPFILSPEPLPYIDEELPEGVVAKFPVDPDLEEHRTTNYEMAAMVDDEWFMEENDYNTAQGWAFQPDAAWRPVNHYRLLDFRSRYLTIADSERRSWSPPPCDCRRLTVWMYGGSTTYGLNQRDDHTIASEIARVAHEHGITVDVRNRGSNGQLHWLEAERFAWDLTIDEPPDLVLFYDGVNDAWAGGAINSTGGGNVMTLQDPTVASVWDSTGRSDGPVPPGPPGSKLLGLPNLGTFQIGALERLTVERYDRTRTVSRRAAEAHGVVARYVWQPSRYSRPLVLEEPHGNGEDENRSRLSEALLVAALPEDVIDATGALLGTDAALFTDDVHHNELGSRLIAEEIFRHIRPDLVELSRSSPPHGARR